MGFKRRAFTAGITDYAVEDIEGIGPAYAAKLSVASIFTTKDLLARCSDPKGRKDTAEATDVSVQLLLKWANIADLMRIDGIGSEFSELLEMAGVDTVRELRRRDPERLTEALRRVSATMPVTRVLPGMTMVTDWIEQAKKLDPVITY